MSWLSATGITFVVCAAVTEKTLYHLENQKHKDSVPLDSIHVGTYTEWKSQKHTKYTLHF